MAENETASNRFSGAQQQQFVSQALARGMSQGKINSFLADNPYDYHRLQDVEADGKPPAPSAPRTAGAPTGEAPLAGLTALDVGTQTPQTPQSGAVAGMGGMMEPEPPSPIGVATGGIGELRNLGRRTPPMESYALAGLRKIY